MKVLIIDDSIDTLTMLEKFLASNNHECHTSTSGMEGLSLIKQHNFDAVFLDLMMPGFTGYDVLEKMAQNGGIKKSKVIVFTATSIKEEETDNLLGMGVHAVLKKPIDLKLLIQPLTV